MVLPQPTLIIELTAATGLSTSGQEVFQPKNPLNIRAIKRIRKVELGGDGGTSSYQPPKKALEQATITNLARTLEGM